MNDAVCDSSSPALTGEQSAHTEEIGAVGQTCDECSPCWPHRGWLRVCSCDCHPADPAADLEHALLKEALRLACEDGWDDGQWAMRRYIEMAQAHLSGREVDRG